LNKKITSIYSVVGFIQQKKYRQNSLSESVMPLFIKKNLMQIQKKKRFDKISVFQFVLSSGLTASYLKKTVDFLKQIIIIIPAFFDF
jgi:hypothetical protein